MNQKDLLQEIEGLRNRVAELEGIQLRHEETERELRRSENKFRMAFDHATCGMAIVGLDGRFCQVNQALCHMFEYSEDELQGLTFQSLTHPDDLQEGLDLFRDMLQGQEDHGWLEKRYLNKEGRVVWAILSTCVVPGEDGRPLFLVSQIQDITDRKRAEETLRESEQRFELALNGADLGLWDWHVQTGCAFVNQRSVEIVGYELDEVEQSFGFWEGLLHPEDKLRAVETIYAHMEGLSDYYQDEYRVKAKSGEWKWIFAQGKVVERDPEGKPLRMAGTYRDTTDSKITEEALRESESRYRELVEKANDIIYRTDENGFFVLFNPVGLTITGYSQEEISHKHYLDLIHPDYKKQVDRFYGLQFVKRIPDTYHEVPIITKQGKTIWIGQNVHLLVEGDTIVGFQSICRDITDRKRATDELAKASERVSMMLESISDGFFALDQEMRVTYFNKAAEQLLGRKSEEVLGKGLFEAFPETKGSIFDEKYSQALREKTQMGFETYFEIEPYENWYEVRVYPFEDGISVYFQVTTDRKEAEQTLRESEQRYRLLADNTLDTIWQMDLDLRFTYVNPAIFRMTGYKVDEWVGTKLAEHCDEENFMKMAKAVSEEVAKGINTLGMVVDAVMLKKNKEPFSVEIHGKVIFGEDGLPIAVQGVTRDISERKRAEEALRQTQEMLWLALDGANLGIWEWDLTTGKSLWSERTHRQLGYEPDEFQPNLKNWKKRIHPDDWPEVSENLNLHMEGKLPVLESEYRILNKSGEWKWVQAQGKVIEFDPDGKPTRMAGVVADITERKKADEALRESRKKLQTIFEASPAGIILVNPEGIITFANQKMGNLFSRGCEELLGTPYVDLVLPSERSVGHGKMRSLMEGEIDHVSLERRYQTGDGREFLGRLSGRRILREDGTLEGLVGIITDITDSKKAEEALRESEERYRSLFENMIEGFSYCKMLFENGQPHDFIYLAVNDAFEKQTGLKDVAGKRASEVIPGIREADPVLFEIYGRVAMTGQPECFEIFVKSLQMWFWVSAYSPKSEHFVAMFDVIADRKRAEEQIQRRGALLSAVNLLLREALESETDADIARTCLRMAEKIAGSRFGFIGEVNQDGRLDTIALSDPGWLACQMTEADVPLLINNMEIRGIWASVLKTDQSQMINDPTSHPDSVGVPDGHPPVISVMGVPLKRSGKTFGLIALANKDGGYDPSDVADVEALSSVFVEALDRSRTERALRDSEQLMKGILSTSPVGIAFTRDRMINWANEAWVKMFGFENEQECRGQSSRMLYLSEEEYHRTGRTLYTDVQAGKVAESDVTFKRKDGSIFAAHVRMRVLDPSSPEKGSVSAVTDISDRKRAGLALRDSEKRYRRLFEAAKDGLLILDSDTAQVVDVNPFLTDLLGYSQEELLQKKFWEIGLFEDDARCRSLFAELQDTDRVSYGDLPLQKKGGTSVEVEFVSNVYLVDGNRVIQCNIRDITDRKRLERQLLQSQKMEAVGTLAGGVAHDFNNVLQVALGYSDLILSDEKLPDRYRADLQKIRESARRGADLVQRLLTFSRKAEIKPQPLNLNRRITELRKMLERTIPKMIDMELLLDENLAAINADHTQVDQVLMNLAVNARDAMPEGGKLIFETANIVLDEEYVKTHLDVKPGHYVVLMVTDTGSGMDLETLEHIFEPFFTTKEMGRGTGLGLAMVHGIVKQHNGHITVYSEVGKGTTFKVYFPAIEAEVETSVEATGIMPAFGTETVLLVDDEEFVRELGARILTKHGYTVLKAENGREALDLFKKERSQISLVILDLIMPELGGRECLKELLKIDPEVNVLVASGYSAESSVRETIQIGAKGFITKPFRVKELIRNVRRVLDDG